MTFEVKFLNQTTPEDNMGDDQKKIVGQITINDFSERLFIPLDKWSVEDYLKQWIDALDRILSSDVAKVGIFTEMYSPTKSRYPATCWALYRNDNKVYVQNFYQPLDNITEDFNFEELYALIDKRDTSGDVSEWEVDIQSIETWQEKLKSETVGK